MKNKLSTTQKIEVSREIRMWCTRVILPTIGGILYIDYRYPDLKDNIKEYFVKKFGKKESERKWM